MFQKDKNILNMKNWRVIIPDDHFDWIYTHAQPFAFRNNVGDTPTAVGELRVEVHPLSRGRLGHDVDVNLQQRTLFKIYINTQDYYPSPSCLTVSIPSPL